MKRINFSNNIFAATVGSTQRTQGATPSALRLDKQVIRVLTDTDLGAVGGGQSHHIVNPPPPPPVL